MRTLRIVALSILVLALVGVSPASGRMYSRMYDGHDQVRLPLDDYRLARAEQIVVNKALHLLTTRCMRVRDYPDITIPPSLVGAVEPIPVNDRRYGVVSEAAAHQFGYHLPVDSGSDRRAAALDAWLATLGSPEELALYGTEEEPALADPRWNLDSPQIPDQEIHTAVVDVRCKKMVGLVETWVRVETEIQQASVRRNGDELARLAEARREYVLNAERVVGVG